MKFFFETKIPRYLLVKNELFLLYLRGIRGMFEKKYFFLIFRLLTSTFRERKKPYNFYPLVFSVAFSCYCFEYFTNQLKNVYF